MQGRLGSGVRRRPETENDPILVHIEAYTTNSFGEREGGTKFAQSNEQYDSDDDDARWGSIKLLLLGQLLAVALTGTGTFSQFLANRDVNIPTTQSFLLYLALAMCFVPRVWAKRRRQGKGLMVAWWKYLLVAIADVEGNFLLVLAFQYTTITSVTLLDCFTIPCVMILSKLLFQVKYRSKHAAGATICLAGLGLLVASDVIRNRNGADGAQASNQVYGDLLVLAGSAFYATSNVAQEKLVKNYDREEFLAMLGVFGSLVGGGQAALLEYDKLCAVTWDSVTVLLVLGFVTCMFLLYAGTPALLVRSSAVFLNLSLLTADFWSVVVAVELFGASLHWLYFVAFGLIVAGLFIWYTAENGLKDLEPRKAASYQIIETS